MPPSTQSIESGTDEQAQVGPQWVDRFGRVRTPRAYHQDDDGNVCHGVGAEAGWEQYFTQAQAEHQAAVESLTPAGRRAYAQYKRTGVVPAPQFVRTAPRPRGAGRPAVRRAAQRSSARSGDSGDGEGSEPSADSRPWPRG